MGQIRQLNIMLLLTPEWWENKFVLLSTPKIVGQIQKGVTEPPDSTTNTKYGGIAAWLLMTPTTVAPVQQLNPNNSWCYRHEIYWQLLLLLLPSETPQSPLMLVTIDTDYCGGTDLPALMKFKLDPPQLAVNTIIIK